MQKQPDCHGETSEQQLKEFVWLEYRLASKSLRKLEKEEEMEKFEGGTALPACKFRPNRGRTE